MSDLETAKNNFKDLTHQLNNYNEIRNLNIYLKTSGTLEKDRMTKVNENLKSKIMKLKQDYIHQDWVISFMGLKNNLVYSSIYVTGVILIIVGLYLREMLSKEMLFGIITAIVVIYVIFVILIVKVNSDRRNSLWNQYYWSPMISAT